MSSIRTKPVRTQTSFWLPTEDVKHKKLLNDTFPLTFTINDTILGCNSLSCTHVFPEDKRKMCLFFFVVSKAQERGIGLRRIENMACPLLLLFT